MDKYAQNLRSNLKIARNLGSAKEGTSHWWMQRFTSIMLIPLSIWFIILVIKIFSMKGEELFLLLRSPFNIILMMVFISTSIYHGLLGIKVIIEDYVHCEGWKFFLIILSQIVSYMTIIAVICAIATYHFVLLS